MGDIYTISVDDSFCSKEDLNLVHKEEKALKECQDWLEGKR